MSLRRLMRNYITLQTSEDAAQSDDGALNRQSAWTNVAAYTNIRCAIQEGIKRSIFEDHGNIEEDVNTLIYHENLTLYAYNPNDIKQQPVLRILSNRTDPRQKITFPVADEETVDIYKWFGHIAMVRHQRRKVYILKAQKMTSLALA